MKRQGLFVINEPGALRISPALAQEIGLNESIFLLQIEYLIQTSTTEEKEGKLWTYQSLQHLKDAYFSWWSIATISRIAKSCAEKGLIEIGNFNQKKYDRTQWYCLSEEGINQLTSVHMNDTILQNEKSNRANCKIQSIKLQNPIAQNERPIPKTPTETPTEGEEADAPAPDWDVLELRQVLRIPEIALFKKVTRRTPGTPQYPIIWETIHKHKFTQADLEPYWKAWATKGYRSENLSWLTEWAVNKKIPDSPNGKPKSPSEKTPPRYVEVHE